MDGENNSRVKEFRQIREEVKGSRENLIAGIDADPLLLLGKGVFV